MKARIPVAVVFSAAFLAAAAAPAREDHVRVVNYSNPSHDAYVLAIGGTTMTTNASTSTIVAVRRAWAGDFLWFRRHRRAFIVRDPTVIEKVRDLFAPLDALRPDQKALGRREKDVDREEEALDRERDRIQDSSDADDEEAAVPARAPADEARVKELDARIAELRSRQRALEAEERELDSRADEIERRVEADLWRRIDRWMTDGTAKPAGDPDGRG